MARDEDQAQQVVAHVIVQSGIEIGNAVLFRLEAAPDLDVLLVEALVPPEEIDRAMLGRGHQPRAWISRDALVRPLLERGDEGVLREIFGDADVAHDPRQRRDQLG